MSRIPVLRLRTTLFATLPEDIDDVAAREMLTTLLDETQRTDTSGVIIDVSALDIVDSFLGRIIADVANCASVLDAKTVVCGIQPSVAITLVELGMDFPKVNFALDVDRAVAELEGVA